MPMLPVPVPLLTRFDAIPEKRAVGGLNVHQYISYSYFKIHLQFFCLFGATSGSHAHRRLCYIQ